MLQLQREPSQVENVHGERNDPPRQTCIDYCVLQHNKYSLQATGSSVKKDMRSQMLVNRQMDKFHSVQ